MDDKSQEETEEMELVASARKREDFAKWSADKCADYFMMVEPRFASIIRQHVSVASSVPMVEACHVEIGNFKIGRMSFH